MKLCIAEKPSVAKEIARIVGANQRRDGYFEGNGYQVSWTFGHLCTLKEPHDYTDSWKSWRFDSLPMIPDRFGIKVIENDGVKKQFATIEKLSQNCNEVINCGDAGIEGELIQRWVLTKANCQKPLKRLWISSLTDEAIKEGFAKLMNGADFDLLYAAGNARSIGDWLLGMNATRLYTLKYANGKGVLSIGRVQTPTLSLIVKRHKEITGFLSEPFWELKTTYHEVLFSATQGRFQVKEDAEAFLEKIREDEFEIVSFTRKKGTEAPPKLFDLTSLQVECNKKFGFTADETLRHIQKLYERKLVTYPRVDTTFLPNAMHAKIKGILEKLKPYENFIKPLLTEPIRKSKKVFDDKKITDHHAIIPTGIMPAGLIYHEKQVYDTIARRFIAAFYPDCGVSNTTVIGQTAGVEFKATGKVIVEPGWRSLYPKKETETHGDEEGQLMPEFVKGERGPHTPDLQEKQTQPPKPYTEATLLRAMETAGKQVDDEELSELMKENGIGRPSTRANIIETLFKRKYISRERKNLVPTITGIQLIETIQNDLLKSVELTGMWEKKLRLIENGEYDAKNFLDEMKQMVSDLVKEVKQERRQAITIEEKKEEKGKPGKESGERETKNIITCPKCGKGSMLKGKNAFGCSEYKAGCQFVVSFEQFGKKLTDKQIEALLSKKLTGLINGFVVKGEKTKGVLSLSNDFTVEIKLEPAARDKNPGIDANQLLTCPKCKQGYLLKGKAAFGCSRFREGCRFVVPFADLESRFATHELNAEHLKAFI
ncbi:MAG: DNA topoisomerase III [Bacteroidetes bacterium HGW-Bacteroidetes-4]|jgi:DNA topoisomerase-3|nr:MAG: DNA topoisomerase III [Bacteroidetes bacterium HGW-Bacteroidetes-4]